MQEAKKIPAFSEAEHSGQVIDITNSVTIKSNLNSQYLNEKDKIVKEFGSLENMRLKLGMNKTQIAQLLLIKPATWSRWERNEGKAPPHIFQALKWYIILADAKPEIRTQAPEFIYENQLKVIGSELKKIKSDFDFKGDLMHMMEDKISSMITHGLTQIQVQIQPVLGQTPAFQLDENFKNDQYKIQSKVENVEFLLRQMREDVLTIKSREPFYQAPIQEQKPIATFRQSEASNKDQVNSAAIALKIILGFLGISALTVLGYFFVMYA